MNCPLRSGEAADLLLDYSSGRIDNERKAEFENHVEVCERCAAFLADQGVLWSALDAWEPAPVSADFNRRLWDRIEKANSAPWYRRLADSLSPGAWKPAFPLAAAAIVIAAGFMMDHHGIGQSPRVNGVNGVSVSEADQIERTLDDIQLLRQFDSVPPAANAGSGAGLQPM